MPTTCCRPRWRAVRRAKVACPALVGSHSCHRLLLFGQGLSVRRMSLQVLQAPATPAMPPTAAPRCSPCRRQARAHHPHPPRVAVAHGPQLGGGHHRGPAAVQARRGARACRHLWGAAWAAAPCLDAPGPGPHCSRRSFPLTRPPPLPSPCPPGACLLACSVDESLVFDPTDLAEDVTPAAALKALGQVRFIARPSQGAALACGHHMSTHLHLAFG